MALGSLAAFGFMALLRRTLELRAAQQEVSRLAAERERMRIARDLHDLLGHSLTVVTVKAQLAGRLVGRDDTVRRPRSPRWSGCPGRRWPTCGRRWRATGRCRCADELATAREVLGAAGIAADLPGAVDEVPAERRELFGWVVREGVTNVVRHSGASRVRVRVRRRRSRSSTTGAAAPPSRRGRQRPRRAGRAGDARRRHPGGRAARRRLPPAPDRPRPGRRMPRRRRPGAGGRERRGAVAEPA